MIQQVRPKQFGFMGPVPDLNPYNSRSGVAATAALLSKRAESTGEDVTWLLVTQIWYISSDFFL